jgi:hypothetical protein
VSGTRKWRIKPSKFSGVQGHLLTSKSEQSKHNDSYQEIGNILNSK